MTFQSILRTRETAIVDGFDYKIPITQLAANGLFSITHRLAYSAA